MARIAKAAGVSRATLYREFKHRRDLERVLQQRGAEPGAIWTDRTVRARILEGARRAIAEHGLLTVTVDQIARAASLGEATVYRHFNGKDAILRAAFDELPPRQAILTQLEAPGAPLEVTLLALIEALLSFAAREPEMLRLIAFGHGAELRYVRSLREGQRSAISALSKWLAAQQRRGLLRRCAPKQLVGALLGAAYARSLTLLESRAAENPRMLRVAAEEIVDVFLAGAKGTR